jgi:Ca2+-binding EF-hand superfamily protein
LHKVNEKEITELEKQYHKLKITSPKVDKAAFKTLFGPQTGLPEHLIEKLFETFDKDKDGIVNVTEFLVGLSYCCRGSEEQKLQCIAFLPCP